MKRLIVLPIVLALAIVMGGCTDNPTISESTTQDEQRQVELAYPYIYEKGINYNGDLSAQEVRQCLGNVRMYWSSKPSEFNYSFLYNPPVWDSTIPQIRNQAWFDEIKQKVKAGDARAIDELNATLAQLIQVYQPDKVGFEIHQDVSSNFGLSLAGEASESEMSWNQVVSKLGLNNEPGVVKMAKLLTETGKKIRIKYVKNSLEQICLAYRNIQIDLAGTNFLLRDCHFIDYDQEKNMLNFRLRSDVKEPYDGYILTPPEFISKLNPPELNVQALIKKKYSQLIYYSEFNRSELSAPK